MSCSDCSYQIISIINAEVNATLAQVQRIQYLTTAFNRLFGEIGGEITDDLQSLVNVIPPPPTLVIQELINMLLCPLTPLAVQIALQPQDITTLPTNPDPRLLLATLVPSLQPYVNTIVQSYEAACSGVAAFSSTDDQGKTVVGVTQSGFANHTIQPNHVTIVVAAAEGTFTFADNGGGLLVLQAPIPGGFSLVSSSINYDSGFWTFTLNSALSAGGKITLKYGQPVNFLATQIYFISLMRKYLQEMYRVLGDPADFLLNYAVNLARAQLVKTTCPDIYNDPQWSFKALDTALIGWSFNGLLPSGIDQRAQPVLNILAEGEAKLLAWKTVSSITL